MKKCKKALKMLLYVILILYIPGFIYQAYELARYGFPYPYNTYFYTCFTPETIFIYLVINPFIYTLAIIHFIYIYLIRIVRIF